MLLLVVLVFSLGLFADTWYNNYEKALKAIEKNNWSAAIQYLHAALQEKDTPKLNAKTVGLRFVDYLPYYYLGLAYYRSGQFSDAAVAFEQSLNYNVVQKKSELFNQLEQMFGECRAKLDVRQKESKESKAIDAVQSPVILKPLSPPQENTSTTVRTPSPESKPPLIPEVSGVNAVDSLLMDGAKLYKVGELVAAREKFSAVLQLEAHHPDALKWLKTIAIAMGVKDLNQGIRCYFASDRSACERNLRQVIDVFIKEADPKSLVVAYQFLAVVLIEKHLLEDDPGEKWLQEARLYIEKIKAIQPNFHLEDTYFSPKVVKIFSGKQ